MVTAQKRKERVHPIQFRPRPERIYAATIPRRSSDREPQPIVVALKEFCKQTGLQLVDALIEDCNFPDYSRMLVETSAISTFQVGVMYALAAAAP